MCICVQVSTEAGSVRTPGAEDTAAVSHVIQGLGTQSGSLELLSHLSNPPPP